MDHNEAAYAVANITTLGVATTVLESDEKVILTVLRDPDNFASFTVYFDDNGVSSLVTTPLYFKYDTVTGWWDMQLPGKVAGRWTIGLSYFDGRDGRQIVLDLTDTETHEMTRSWGDGQKYSSMIDAIGHALQMIEKEDWR